MKCDKCDKPIIYDNPPTIGGKPVCDMCARVYVWDVIDDASRFDVWQMDTRGTSRRIARCETLADASDTAKCDMGYTYVMGWTTIRNPIQLTIETTSRYVVGYLDGWLHTRDMRATVRNVLVGAR